MAATESLPARFARIVAQLGDESVLDRYCEAGRRMLEADGAALTVNHHRPDRHTLSATAPLALMIEDAQDVAGEGPGFDASRCGEVVIGSFADGTSSPWPMLIESVAALGFAGSVAAVPILVRGRPLGVLTAHRDAEPLVFDEAVTHFLATSLGVVLADQLTPETLAREIAADWVSRAVIYQAAGMVVVQVRIDVAGALSLMRAHAYAHEHTMVDVAVQVVERDVSFSPLDARGR